MTVPCARIRIVIIACVFAAACSGIFSGCRHREDIALNARRPSANVILISLDTLRKDRLSAYGSPLSISPFLDRFCQSALVFEDVVSQSASTWTSHRSIFMSRYVHGHPVGDPDPSMTLAGQFQQAGYRTAAFVDGGKMHSRYGHAAGFDLYDDTGGHLESIVPRARQWLLDHCTGDSDTPFFLFLHTYDIHAPYNPEDLDDRVFLGNTTVPSTYRTEAPRYLNTLNLNREQLEQLSRLYNGGVRSCDRRLAALFHFLVSENIMDNTVVMLMSDHGESLGERRRLGHHEMYYVQLAVPLILKIPNFPARLVPGPVENLDIMPTLLNITNVPMPGPPARIDGVSQLETIETGVQPLPDRYHLAENRQRTIFRDMGWKLIVSDQPDTDRLHNLADNPEETVDYLKDHPRRASELMQAMTKVTGQQEPALRKPAARELPVEIFKTGDQKLKHQLEMLGYLDKAAPESSPGQPLELLKQ